MAPAMVNMGAGVGAGITQPHEVMVKVVPHLDAQFVSHPRASVFYEPIRNFPKDFDAPTRRALTDKYVRAIQQQIVPAYRRLRAFVQDEYLPRCRSTVGLSALPRGEAMYAYAVRPRTTTDL